jgi:uncharacterized protein (DUF58 family)
MLFATRGAFKGVRAAEMAALIAWSAVANGDRLGGLVFSETEHHELRPALGARSALRLLQTIAAESFWQPALASEAAEIDAERALQRLTRVARTGSVILLLSDFRRIGADAERHCASSQAIAISARNFFDPVEAELPPPGRYRIHSAGRSFAIETANVAMRRRYQDRFEERRAGLRALARVPGVRVIDCATDAEPRSVLAQQFRPR